MTGLHAPHLINLFRGLVYCPTYKLHYRYFCIHRCKKMHCHLVLLLLLTALAAAAAKRVQVFGFSPEQKLPTFKGYDWSVLTTSAWRPDPELIALANEHGAKVELLAADVQAVMGDPAKRKKWVSTVPCPAVQA